MAGPAARYIEPVTLRIAMWSGPRNISTAMMRAWENRPDTAVVDEPLYAHYLAQRAEIDHPGRTEVLANCESDWRRVVDSLMGPAPGGRQVWYQKHMAHHLLPSIERGWIASLTNAFLIRDPARVLASLARVTRNTGLQDTGLPQQVELFEREADRLGAAPPVIDAADVLADPRRVLSRLCASLGVPFSERMLSWPVGPRPTDGVWAPHWYAAVERSTGFEADHPHDGRVPEALRPVLDRCLPLFERLRAFRIL